MFRISTFSNGVVIVYINDKKYEYYVDDMARVEYLKNKYRRNPGKLFNEIKLLAK